MGIKQTMIDTINRVRGKIKTKEKGKQTYYGMGKEIVGGEGTVAKRKKKTNQIYNELFPEG